MKTKELGCIFLGAMATLAVFNRADADSATYIMRGNGSGFFNGVAFSDRDFSLTATADTDNIIGGPVFTLVNDMTDVFIDGIGTDILTNEIQTVSNQNTDLAGFGDNNLNLGIHFANNPVFATYDLSTSLPETPGVPVFNSGINFTTSSGSVSWSDVTSISFQAIVVPEPAAATPLLFGLLISIASLARHRR
ncbi:MAG: hypothetical protein AAGF97_12840 [Planctomycetota bacterium]